MLAVRQKSIETTHQQIEEKLELVKEWLSFMNLDEKPHQLEGIKWCLTHELKIQPKYGIRGGFVCDEMGLGKSFLMLGCILTNQLKNTLIVVPLALLQQWKALIYRVFDGVECLVYHGSSIKKLVMDDLKNSSIILTTYGMIARRNEKGYKSPLWDISWDRVIYDEAHHMRNSKTGTYWGGRNIDSKISWIVTGTPIQNHNSDFVSLCEILKLKDIMYENPSKIREIIKSHLLRRTKKDVGIDISDAVEEVVIVPWTDEEKVIAKHIHSYLQFLNVTVDNVDSIIGNLENHMSFAGRFWDLGRIFTSQLANSQWQCAD